MIQLSKDLIVVTRGLLNMLHTEMSSGESKFHIRLKMYNTWRAGEWILETVRHDGAHHNTGFSDLPGKYRDLNKREIQL